MYTANYLQSLGEPEVYTEVIYIKFQWSQF
jgi:hypothetical protein